jgi:hypothetical protein
MEISEGPGGTIRAWDFIPLFEKKPKHTYVDPEFQGALLEISWDIKPVELRDVHLLFSGLESLLNETARAVLADEKFRNLIDEVALTRNLLEIELLNLELGSLGSVLKIVWNATNRALTHPVISNVVGGLTVYAFTALAPNDPRPYVEPLPPHLSQKVEQHAKTFTNGLKSLGKKSELTLRDLTSGDQITISVPDGGVAAG